MLNATVVKKQILTPELFIITVKPDSGVPDFLPGQYVALGLPGSAPRAQTFPGDKEQQAADKLIKRAYSIGSSPNSKEGVEFYIAVVPEGALTPRLVVPSIGDRVYIAPKITGTFTIDSLPPEKNLVLVSTGTGVAPYLSMIRTPATWTPGRKITVVHGVRFSKDLGYRAELEQVAKNNSQFRYIPIVSRTDPEWSGEKGRIQRLFEERIVSLDPKIDHVYLCGNPAMVEEMERLLTGWGYSEYSKKKNPLGTLHLEKYW